MNQQNSNSYNQNFNFSYSPSENVRYLLINVYLIRWTNIAENLFLSSKEPERQLRTLFNSLRMFYLLIRPSLVKQGKQLILDDVFKIKMKNNRLKLEDYSFETLIEFEEVFGMLLHTASIELGLNIDVKLEVQGLMTDNNPVQLSDFDKGDKI